MSVFKSPASRRALPLIVLTALAAAASGCATSGYLADRRVDALDVLTATLGEGYGVRALAGPANAGLLMNVETGGLKGGEAIIYEDEGFDFFNRIELTLTLFSLEQYTPGKNKNNLNLRHKHYVSRGVLGLTAPLPPKKESWSSGHLYRLTQLEVAGGIVYTGKFGLNPGELLDFILGWTTLDIYDDDLGRTEGAEQTQDTPPLDPDPSQN